MKRTITLLAAAVALAAFATSALAQSKECNDDNKRAWYQKVLDNRNGDGNQQKIAYAAAKDYLNCGDAPEDPVAQWLKKWVAAYEKVTSDVASKSQFEAAFNNKNYAEAMRLGKLAIATDPDYVKAYIFMGVAGFNASTTGDTSLLADSVQYAKKAIELVQAGKPFAPFASKDEALAYENFAIATAYLKTAPADAIPFFVKVARLESPLKKNPSLYINLAQAYNDGPRAELTDKYNRAIPPDKSETPETKLALANLNQVLDRQIDAMARAVALATSAPDKKNYMDALTELYKLRNKSDTGLNELVASILSRPIPDVPTPITQLPTPTPAIGGSAPGTAGGGTRPASNTNTTSTAGQNKTGSSSGTGTQTGNTGGSAKPTPTPTPKPKPRRAHHG